MNIQKALDIQLQICFNSTTFGMEDETMEYKEMFMYILNARQIVLFNSVINVNKSLL